MNKPGLGTQLRHLVDLLDGAVSEAYAEAGLDYRPRYTPVMRALGTQAPCTVGRIAELAGITQPAATQTIALMLSAGLVEPAPAASDGRQKLLRLSPQGRKMLPKLERCWQATAAAAQSLDEELDYPLSELLAQAISVLQARPFGQRIRESRAQPVSRA